MKSALRQPVAVSAAVTAAHPPPNTLAELRAAVAEELDRLSAVLVRAMEPQPAAARAAATEVRSRLQERIAFLGQVASALASVDGDALPATGAALGSRVLVEDDGTGGRIEYTLMDGALIDLDAGQVSLASPLGRSLLGRGIGAVAEVRTPQRTLRLRILSVRRLEEQLAERMPSPWPVP